MVIQIMYAPRFISMYVKEFVNVKSLKAGVKMSRFIISTYFGLSLKAYKLPVIPIILRDFIDGIY